MKCVLVLFSWIPFILFAQEKGDFILSENEVRQIQYKSNSAFMQYSGFVPTNFKEILISVSGNDVVDSLLFNLELDTLIENGASFFDSYLRKDYGLKSIYSPTLQLFSTLKIYDEEIIKSAIVYFYALYLKKEEINLYKIRKRVLKNRKNQNNKARKNLIRQQKSRS